MVYMQSHIWKLFCIVMFVGLFILGFVTYELKNQIDSKYELEQENIARVISNSTNKMLSQYEVTLDVLGEYLIKDDTYKDVRKSKEMFKKLLKINPSIADLSLVNPNGRLYVTSIDKSIDKLPNLLVKKETKNSFEQALKSNTMVLGRTYFHKTLNTYIIPLRKVIRDKNLNILAVMVAGIKVKDWHLLMKSNNNYISKYESFLFRDFDYYMQLIPSKNKHKKRYYSTNIPEKHVDYIKALIRKKTNMPINGIKSKGVILTINHKRFIDNQEVMSSIEYLEKYKLFSVVEIPYSIIKKEFYGRLIPIYIFFISIGTFIFFLFSQLSKIVIKNRKKLEHQAEHDYLTNINNRYYLSKKFDYSKLLKPFTLIILNIDNFKNINENYGNKYGDMALKEIGRRLYKIKKEDDILVRYSGDEFLFIRYSIGKKESVKLAQEIIEAIYNSYSIGLHKFNLGTSIGIAGYPNDGENFDSIKKYADIALQEAKKKKNCYMFCDEKIKQKHLRYSLIEKELKTALQNNEIYMMYQPQVRSDGTLYGVEALVRWQNEKLGFVPPDEFISVAEQTGMMVKLGQYIIKTSLTEVDKIYKETNKRFQLSINISVKQFEEITCYENLLNMIEHTGFDKSLLTLEVTENLFIEDIELVLNILENIRKQDIKISLDDFGTGYSSLSLLKKLPINELKIDKSFIDDIETNMDAMKMVEGIMLIGKQLNMTILAEGIEKIEQKNILDNYGCDLFQGYHFSKPLKKEALLDFI